MLVNIRITFIGSILMHKLDNISLASTHPRSSMLTDGPDPVGFFSISSWSCVFFSSSDKFRLLRRYLLFTASSRISRRNRARCRFISSKSSHVRIPWNHAGGFGFGGSRINSDLESSSKLPTERESCPSSVEASDWLSVQCSLSSPREAYKSLLMLLLMSPMHISLKKGLEMGKSTNRLSCMHFAKNIPRKWQSLVTRSSSSLS